MLKSYLYGFLALSLTIGIFVLLYRTDRGDNLDAENGADYLTLVASRLSGGETIRLDASSLFTETSLLKQREFTEPDGQWTLTRREIGNSGYGGQWGAWTDCEFITRGDKRWLVCGRAGGHMDAGLSDAFSYALHENRGWVRVLNPRPLSCVVETGDPEWPTIKVFDQNDYDTDCAGRIYNRFMPNMGHTYGSRTHDSKTGRTFEAHIASFPGPGGSPRTWYGNLAAIFDWSQLDLDGINPGPHPYFRSELASPRTGFLINNLTGRDAGKDITEITHRLSARYPASCQLDNGVIFVWTYDKIFYFDIADRRMLDIVPAPFRKRWGTIECAGKTILGFSAKWSDEETKDRAFEVLLDENYHPVSHHFAAGRMFRSGSQFVAIHGQNYIYTGEQLLIYDFDTNALTVLHDFPRPGRSYKKAFFDAKSGTIVIARTDGVWVHRIEVGVD